VREQDRSSYGKLVDEKLREKGSEGWLRDGKEDVGKLRTYSLTLKFSLY
jgi:hypothetical protein